MKKPSEFYKRRWHRKHTGKRADRRLARQLGDVNKVLTEADYAPGQHERITHKRRAWHP